MTNVVNKSILKIKQNNTQILQEDKISKLEDTNEEIIQNTTEGSK